MDISIVIPIYNEAENINELYDEIIQSLKPLNKSYEIIFVDDGSTDNSYHTLKELLNKSRTDAISLTGVCFTRNFGKSVAMQAGFDVSKGDLIITLDGDLQDVPANIPKLLKEQNNGFDVVCGWRCPRKDPFGKMLASKITNIIRKIRTRETIHDVGCNLRVFRKAVLKDVYLSEGMHRFFALIMQEKGYKIAEVKVSHRVRKFGKTKYKIYEKFFQIITNLLNIRSSGLQNMVRHKPYYEIKEIITA